MCSILSFLREERESERERERKWSEKRRETDTEREIGERGREIENESERKTSIIALYMNSLTYRHHRPDIYYPTDAMMVEEASAHYLIKTFEF